MEEDAVLVVVERVVDFLVPYNATVGRLVGTNLATYPVDDAALLLTEISTNLIQYVLPIKSLASTAAPCSPV